MTGWGFAIGLKPVGLLINLAFAISSRYLSALILSAQSLLTGFISILWSCQINFCSNCCSSSDNFCSASIYVELLCFASIYLGLDCSAKVLLVSYLTSLPISILVSIENSSSCLPILISILNTIIESILPTADQVPVSSLRKSAFIIWTLIRVYSKVIEAHKQGMVCTKLVRFCSN